MLEGISQLMTGLVNDYGLWGFFFASIIANATIFFPLPIDALVLFYSGVLENVWQALVIGIVVGCGSAIGEMSGYILGYAGHKGMERLSKKQEALFYKAGDELESRGFIFIIIASMTPIPFDAVGLAAGFIRYNPLLFFVGALIGKLLRYVIIAIAGFYGLHWLIGIMGAGV